MIEEATKQNQTQKILVNKFVVPESAHDEFMRGLRVNRAFTIKALAAQIHQRILSYDHIS